MSLRGWALGLVCGVVLVTGCSVVEAGTPRPAENGAEPGSTSTSGPDESNPLDGHAPCDVLTAEDEAHFGFQAGAPLGDQGCDWKKTFGIGVLVMLFPQEGAGDLAGQSSPVDLGTFDGYLLERPQGVDGECSVVLDTSASSHVRIAAISEKNTDAACDLAVSVAERVADHLS
ncbi:DUF3558 family protein [Actinophytocola xanthii]|uniref:DUF3558 domain-containing protein n=1 Tax=Actinophytocola xanthii TaxID=1912961 RepID=A0A1Q8BQE7_9PSEU|nr:DUF3558 family protein [Actinophytocola xanthii]OLF04332.1 hypothetical protein BU204_37780 [Actinophytocola xanthii]